MVVIPNCLWYPIETPHYFTLRITLYKRSFRVLFYIRIKKRLKYMLTPQKIFSIANVPPNICLFCCPNPGMALHETANFHVLRDNFPIAPGHIMISSKQHFGSLGELDRSIILELENLKKKIESIFKQLFGSAIFYEHGRAGSCHATIDPNLQCEHFHLHCLPLSVCIHKNISTFTSKTFRINSLGEIVNLFEKWGEYLYFENNQNESIYYPVLQTKVPPHFLRTIICQVSSTPEKANWQTHQVYEDFLENFNLTQQIIKHLER